MYADYSKISTSDQDYDSENGDSEVDFLRPSSAFYSRACSTALHLLFLVSLTANAAFFLARGPFVEEGSQSSLAHLSQNIPVPFGAASDFHTSNISHRDELWASVQVDEGIVALDADLSLLNADVFPWDHSKRVYMLNGHHSLHCLSWLYRSLREFEQNIPQSVGLEHLYHCLDTLRVDVHCYADDTPRPVTHNSHDGQHGQQTRLCRDWSKLEQFATQHSACFKRVAPDHPDYQTLNEWKWCPEGSPYQATVEAHFDGMADT